MEASRVEFQNGHRPEMETTLTPLPTPQETEGFSLPDESAELSRLDHKTDGICGDNAIKVETAVMDDGTKYPVLTGYPRNPISDTAIVFTTAWMTSTHGHNKQKTFKRMLEIGYPTIMIGPEGQLRSENKSRHERFKGAGDYTLYRNAHNMNRILDEKLPREKVQGRPLNEQEVIVLGESRGAITGAGFDVEKYSGSRRMAYGDLTAPVFPEKVVLHEWPGILSQLPGEAAALGKLGIKLAIGKQLGDYRGTVHADWEYYLKELPKVRTFVDGAAGIMARAMRHDTPMHVRTFKDDRWSRAGKWEEIYAGRPVHLEKARGFHLDIAQPHTLDRISARLGVIAAERGFDGSFEKVNIPSILSTMGEDIQPIIRSLAGQLGRDAFAEAA